MHRSKIILSLCSKIMNTRKRLASQVLDKNSCKRSRVLHINVDTATTSTDVLWEESKVVALLDKSLLGEGKGSDAAAMKKYMRGKFEFYGVKSLRRRELGKEVINDNDQGIQNIQIREFVLVLWEKCQRELQFTAMDFLEKHKKQLCQNVSEFDDNMELFKTLVVTKSWWDTVDNLAYKIVGYLVRTHPNKGVPVMEAWIESEDMWMRRTAIIHQLGSKALTNSDLLFRFCLARCHEEEFFIRKAIGWALRDYAKTQPNKVKAFLLKNKASLSKLSYNEASKHLSMTKK